MLCGGGQEDHRAAAHQLRHCCIQMYERVSIAMKNVNATYRLAISPAVAICLAAPLNRNVFS